MPRAGRYLHECIQASDGTTTASAHLAFCDANGNITDYIAIYPDGSGETNGTVVARYQYDPYGNLIEQNGPEADTLRFRFSSKYYESELQTATSDGLYYYGYRFYSPTLGRWLSRDPIEEKFFADNSNTRRRSLAAWDLMDHDEREFLRPPIVFNAYVFVDNQPIIHSDFMGLEINWHNESPDPIVDVNHVRLKVRDQLLNNPAIYRWFDKMLCQKKKTVYDLLDGDLNVDVYIRDKPLFRGPGQTKWEGVFSGGWPDQPDRTVAVHYKKFKEGFFAASFYEKRAAKIVIHEISHWVEAYSLGHIWKHRPSGYDTGDYVESLISW